jgi:predicted NBD/HSP70 family sugar kinase
MIAGVTNAGGHLGHITVDFLGPECFCGNTGCVEAFFSARAIEGAALAAVRRGCETSLRRDFAANPDKLTCLDVFSAAHAGDRTAAEIVQTAISALAAAMAGMAHTFDPQLFILGGQIAESGEMLFAPLRTELYRRTMGIVGRRIPIRRTALGDSMGVLGAAALAWNSLEGGDHGGPRRNPARIR